MLHSLQQLPTQSPDWNFSHRPSKRLTPTRALQTHGYHIAMAHTGLSGEAFNWRRSMMTRGTRLPWGTLFLSIWNQMESDRCTISKIGARVRLR